MDNNTNTAVASDTNKPSLQNESSISECTKESKLLEFKRGYITSICSQQLCMKSTHQHNHTYICTYTSLTHETSWYTISNIHKVLHQRRNFNTGSKAFQTFKGCHIFKPSKVWTFTATLWITEKIKTKTISNTEKTTIKISLHNS